MRRFLAAAAVFGCLCLFLGCRHVSGFCDCAPTPGLNYWGCPGCADFGAPGTTLAAPRVQPEPLNVMPKTEPKAEPKPEPKAETPQ